MISTSASVDLARILIVEDDDGQRTTLQDILTLEGFAVFTAADREQATCLIQENNFVVAVIDERLPDCSGSELLQQIRTLDRRTRVIVHTAFGSFHSARDAVNLGAFAYLEKLGAPEELIAQVHRAVQAYTTDELRDTEQRLRTITDNAPDLILQVDPQGTILFINRGAHEKDRQEAIGSQILEWAPAEARRIVDAALQRTIEFGKPQQYESTSRSEDGRRRWFAGRMSPVLVDGTVSSVIIVSRDVTATKRAALAQGQQNRILEHVARGVPLEQTLDRLIRSVEGQLPGAVGAIWKPDERGNSMRLMAAPGLPAAIVAGHELSVDLGKRESFDTRSLTRLSPAPGEHLLFADSSIVFAALAYTSGWAYPITSGRGRVVAWFDLYFQEALRPLAQDLDLLNSSARLIGLSIEHDETEQQMRRLNLAIEKSLSGIACIDAEGRIVAASEVYAQILGFEPGELIGSNWEPTLHAGDRSIAQAAHESMLRDGQSEFVARSLRKDGSDFYGQFHLVGSDADSDFHGHYCLMRDIDTRRKAEEERDRLETQLQQSQKMEALGQLAGGVAHDFNNLLTAILGNIEMLLDVLKPGEITQIAPWMHTALIQTDQAGQRASTLTRQLLTFSRKQVRKLEFLDPNEIARSMESILRRLIGESIRLETNFVESVHSIHADASQIEQVIMNLALNARDAMPSGGRMTIETSNVDLDETEASDLGAPGPGAYVMISIGDDGIGIDSETRNHIFEPFFTTKEVGKGTGLGLSTVYGIVTQAEGFLRLQSRTGIGSTFRVYFPAAQESARPEQTPELRRQFSGTETILVCEDEPMVRELAMRILSKGGYTVLGAENGRKALELVQTMQHDLDLLVTDTIMPEMNGKELAGKLTADRPDLRVLFVSGYSHEIIAPQGVLEEGVEFLEKPFSGAALLRRVRQVLDR